MNQSMICRRLALGVVLCATARAAAMPQAANVFSDHMVLQRDRPIRVWGTAEKRERVVVQFDGETAVTNADKQTGRWMVTFAARPACYVPKKLVIEGGGDCGSTTVDDILIGDVWLATGQSNMEMAFRWGVVDGERIQAEAANYPQVRFMKSRWMYKTEIQDEASVKFRWHQPAKVNFSETSAIGWMFATELADRVKVPVGVVDLSYSGSKIEPFIPIEGYRTEPSLAASVAFYDAATNGTPISAWREHTQNMTMHYNGMIAPFTNMAVKGAIWYQGCSNGGEPYGAYAAKMRALVKGWRLKWGYDFPFAFVQLASFHDYTDRPAPGGGYSEVRIDQLDAFRTIPNCGLAVALDVGDAKNIHPPCKQPVADRLARWALNTVYGFKDVAHSGPVYREMAVENDKIRLKFDFAEKGLVSATKCVTDNLPPVKNAGPLREFAISGEDGVWHNARAEIDGATIVVSSPEVKVPKAVRYAFKSNPGYTNLLYNTDLLPAPSFSTSCPNTPLHSKHFYEIIPTTTQKENSYEKSK